MGTEPGFLDQLADAGTIRPTAIPDAAPQVLACAYSAAYGKTRLQWIPPPLLGKRLTTLWERTSAKETVYLSGYLGKASIVAFRGEPTADGTPTWDVFVSPGKGAGR